MKLSPTETMFVAHGGFSARYPENTLPSFLEAARIGAQVIEGDVLLDSSSGELVCYHPPGISSAEGTYSVLESDLRFQADENLPSLVEVLRKLPAQVRFLVDFKQPSENAFRKLVFDSDIDLSRIIVGVRNLADFRLLRQLSPTISTLALFADPDQYREFKAEGGNYYRLWEKDVTPGRVQAIQAQGLEVWVTPGKKATVDDPVRTAGDINQEKLERLLRLRVNAVLVNDIMFALSATRDESTP